MLKFLLALDVDGDRVLRSHRPHRGSPRKCDSSEPLDLGISTLATGSTLAGIQENEQGYDCNSRMKTWRLSQSVNSGECELRVLRKPLQTNFSQIGERICREQTSCFEEKAKKSSSAPLCASETDWLAGRPAGGRRTAALDGGTDTVHDTRYS